MNLNSRAIKPFELQEDERHRRVALPPSKELNRDNPMHPSHRRPIANRRRRMRGQVQTSEWRQRLPAPAPTLPPAPDAKPVDDVQRDRLKLFPELAK
jgi:hypothetical protein